MPAPFLPQGLSPRDVLARRGIALSQEAIAAGVAARAQEGSDPVTPAVSLNRRLAALRAAEFTLGNHMEAVQERRSEAINAAIYEREEAAATISGLEKRLAAAEAAAAGRSSSSSSSSSS